MSAPKWPAGELVPEPEVSLIRRNELIAEVERLPVQLRDAVAGFSAAQLDTRYLNWTIRQIVHHLADSHTNAYVRFRLTLTEDNPTIKPYDETRWAELPDARTEDVELSLNLLQALHTRWVRLLRAMTDEQFARTYHHPEYRQTYSLTIALSLYAHHCRHHLGQILWLKRDRNW